MSKTKANTYVLDLISAGADLAITYTSQDCSELARELSGEFSITAKAFKCDTADSKEVDQSVQKIKKGFGKDVDIAICNAGPFRRMLGCVRR